MVLVGVAAESVPPGTPGHQLWISVANGAPLSGQPVAPAAPQVDPQLAAIQAVIQKANTEQAQAIASGNPSLMSDTATPAHYQQLVQTNQNLVAQGVTSIQLTNLAWGPITINGTTATATSYETWVTTFGDSTTIQSTDTNVYTLVQQNGNWTVQDDQQPTAGTPAAGQAPSAQPTPGAPPGQPAGTAPSQPSAPAAVAPVAPVSPSAQGTSHNWSGYAAAGGSYTGVTGTWTVPQLAATGAPGVGATWVGIGGVSSRDLIQAGTQDVSSGNGQSQFQTWIEMLPAPSQQVPLAVAPGDSITVSITQQSAGSGMWQIAFKNNTSAQTYQTTVQYASSLSSAEWIEEAPSGPNGIVPLDNFGSVGFSSATATQNGQTVNLAQSGAQPITMLNAASQPLAVPSAIANDGSSFSVARTSARATPPTSNGRRPTTTLN
ncbi:MAG: G1 family endopeptidase [Chloroflexota bacterium]|nr:G1 family endopeptidase [Chloroflexota bacterium]